MSDLTDEKLAEVERNAQHLDIGATADATRCMVAEIRRHRTAVRADRERVRSAVADAFAVESKLSGDEYLQRQIECIATRIANALASPAPLLTAEWARAVVLVRMEHDDVRRLARHEDVAETIAEWIVEAL